MHRGLSFRVGLSSGAPTALDILILMRHGPSFRVGLSSGAPTALDILMLMRHGPSFRAGQTFGRLRRPNAKTVRGDCLYVSRCGCVLDAAAFSEW